jgi:hypothetical protein
MDGRPKMIWILKQVHQFKGNRLEKIFIIFEKIKIFLLFQHKDHIAVSLEQAQMQILEGNIG